MKARFASLVVLSLAATIIGARAVVPAGCSASDPGGGEWRSYGGGLLNHRDQAAETALNASNVLNVAGLNAPAAWKLQTSNLAGVTNGGAFQNTPVVADGCVFIATSTGWVIAVNAETGPAPGVKPTPVWAKFFRGQGQTLLGGAIVGSPVVANDVVYVTVSRPAAATQKDAMNITVNVPTGPYVVALNEADGSVLWTRVVEDGAIMPGTNPPQSNTNASVNASPVYYEAGGKQLIFQGIFGNEGTAVARGGFAIVDASATCDGSLPPYDPANVVLPPQTCSNPGAGGTGGSVLSHTYVIDDKDYNLGYRGASVWCTAAVDEDSSQIYACGGNPASKKLEHRYSNALLKIDGDPGSGTFGKIVDSFKGNTDQYYPGLDRQPACDAFGETLVYVAWSVTCLQLDLDFGASPNLFTDSQGNLLVGGLQKSGVYYAVHADDMSGAWSTVIGPPCFPCNSTSPAIGTAQGALDPAPIQQVFAVGSVPSQMVGFTADSGRYRWAFPILDGIHYQSVSTANGLVFAMDNAGGLNVFDGATGALMVRRPLSLDSRDQGPVDVASAGVAIARHTIFAASGNTLVALR
jgi:outer membrane protein assembly factor BamB